MGFFSGRVTFNRYRVRGKGPRSFNADHLAKLAENLAGRQRLATADGIESGWIAGSHILDSHFDLAKNIINDMLFFSLRVDTMKLPADLFRAYYQIDLEALALENPNGQPTGKQKREAKESANKRLEKEAKDGRYTRRKATEVVWDAKSHELLFGTNSYSQVDRLLSLFHLSFGFKFEPVTAGRRAFQLAELHQRTRAVDDAIPSPFVPGVTPDDVAWVIDQASRDFLGNELLLWLWYRMDTGEDVIKLSDGSEATVAITRTLTLDCPRGVTGNETIRSEGPGQLPEAKRAIQSGKLPRKTGLTISRQGAQYELTFQAESLGVGGARLPGTEEEDENARHTARADQIRHLIETLDLLYDAFGEKRFTSDWTKELASMQRWLQREDRHAA